MRIRTELERSYRVLGLAFFLFLLGAAGMWLRGDHTPDPSTRPPNTREAGVSAALFAGYPAPSQFKTVVKTSDGFAGEDLLTFSGFCRDAYLTILLFRKNMDYRVDPARAVVNRAMPCPPLRRFSYELSLKDIPSMETGEYYAFVADQGDAGLWYNPR